MDYVSKIRRIYTLETARRRANHCVINHPESDIDFRIDDKIQSLRIELSAYNRNQIKLSCKLLNVSYSTIFFGTQFVD